MQAAKFGIFETFGCCRSALGRAGSDCPAKWLGAARALVVGLDRSGKGKGTNLLYSFNFALIVSESLIMESSGLAEQKRPPAWLRLFMDILEIEGRESLKTASRLRSELVIQA